MKKQFSVVIVFLALAACSGGSNPPAATPSDHSTPAGAAANPPPTTSTRIGDLAAAARAQQEGADKAPANDSDESSLERIATLPPAGQLPQIGNWVAGTHYQIMVPAQPTDSRRAKSK